MDSIINQALANNTFNIFLAIFLTILSGQTIQPIPKVLKRIYYRSFLIKYCVLILVGCRLFYPLNKKKLLSIIIFAFILLYLLEILRKYD